MKLLNVSNKSLIDRHPFNGLFARTTGVSRSPERLNYLDFNEARVSWSLTSLFSTNMAISETIMKQEMTG